MRSFIRFSFVVQVLAVSFVLQRSYADGDEPIVGVRQALFELDEWLGPRENGDRWRVYLRSKQLEAELSKGQNADPAAVAEILGRYMGEADGLEMPRFVAVREAIDAWRVALTVPDPERLIEAAKASKDRFVPTSAADVRRSRRRLRAANRDLNRFLRRMGENGGRWREFLHQDDLDAQLAADKADSDTLNEVNLLYRSGFRGLELPVFARVSDALRLHLDRLRAIDTPNGREQFQQATDVLVANLEAALAEPQEDDLLRLARTIGWFDARRQLTPLVEGIRRHFSKPNLYVRVSGRFIGKMQREVDETAPIRDVILGTRIRGTGHTTGRVAIELVPDDRRAAFDAVFVGANRSRTTGYNGPAVIRSRGLTRITARKRIYLDENGILALGTEADAQTSSTTTGVSTTVRVPLRGLVTRIASKKVCQKKGQGERMAARHAERQFRSRMDEQTDEIVMLGNDAYYDKFRRPLVERDYFPRQLSFRTTAEHLYLSALAASRSQFGAQSAAPQIEGDPDLALRMHESAANNLLFGTLAGVHMENEDVKAQLLDTFGRLPERFKNEEGSDPWSITFASDKPITVHFDDGQFTLTIRGRRFTSGRRSFPTGMEISVRYAVEMTSGGLRGTRQGDVGATPPGWDGKRRFSLREQTLRRMVQRRFGKMFQQEIAVEDIQLPEAMAAVGKIRPVQFIADDGWLVLGFRADTDADADDAPQSARHAGPAPVDASGLLGGLMRVCLQSLPF